MANKLVQNDKYRLSGTYERLRRSLLDQPANGNLDRPLAYWVLPNDKRLPIAFLDRPLSDLLSQPIEELMATPGVGQKKILGFFDLLRRAAKTPKPSLPFGLNPKGDSPDGGTTGISDAASVSEAVWTTWCETVNRCGFRDEPLGRLAPSLRSLPTVIWHRPLGDYADRSLTEIRQLKTHGNKRVSAILEVFRTVHEAASVAVLPEAFDLCLTPRFIVPVMRWLLAAAAQPSELTVDNVKSCLIDPLVQRTRVDLGATVAQLVEDRLAIEQHTPTVRQQADRLGVTRARVYQLLEDSARAMEVRWPEGRWLISSVASRAGNAEHEPIALIRAAHDLYFPADRQSSDDQPVMAHSTDR